MSDTTTRIPYAPEKFNTYIINTSADVGSTDVPTVQTRFNWTDDEASAWTDANATWSKTTYKLYANEITRTKPVEIAVKKFIVDFHNANNKLLDRAAASTGATIEEEVLYNFKTTRAKPTHIFATNDIYYVCMKIYRAFGDSCEYCHYIGIDSSGSIIRTNGFTLNVFNSPTGIPQNTLSAATISISPNPFTSATTITFSEAQKNTTIKITDLLGKEIKTINFTGEQLTIEKAEMKAGIYFVQTTDEQKRIYNRKIIIQ